MATSSGKLLVAAIDFGTTFSGYAFSFQHEHESDPTKVNGKVWHSDTGQLAFMQTPTCILLKPDKTFHSFGYDAEAKFSDLAVNDDHEDWYFFKHFKMKLHDQIGLKRDINLEDATGKSLPAILIFSLAIKFLKDDLINECQDKVTEFEEEDIHWVLTTPAIWSDAAKQFMREAAIKAGIKTDALDIALEPEAASIYCRHLKLDKKKDPEGATVMKSLTPGTKYVVVDAGGGTVDITVHEVLSDYSLKEIHIANGGPWGGTMVDGEFRQFLIKILGSVVMEKFKKKYMDDYLELTRDFELKKRNIKPDTLDKVAFRVPSSLRELFETTTDENIEEAIDQMNIRGKANWKRDKLQLDADLMKSFFEPSIQEIIRHLRNLLQEERMRDITYMLMVGGFSESALLQSAIKKEFRSVKILIPQDAGAAVLKGSVNFGHNPSSINERKSKHTYGITTRLKFIEGQHEESMSVIGVNGEKYCDTVFGKHVEIAQTLHYGEWQKEHAYTQDNPTIKVQTIAIYASFNKNPVYVTDPDCIKLGELCLPLPDAKDGEVRNLSVQMCYSGTELAVKAKSTETGEVVEGSFDFLG